MNLQDVIEASIFEKLSNLHTSTIGKITAVGTNTISCRPVISRKIDDEKIDLPVLIEVPFFVLGGGSSNISMPIAVGDYCILMFMERSFDNWTVGKDYETPLDDRMHDYSDAIALVGLKKGSIADKITINGDVEINGEVTINGNLIINGSVTASGGYS